MQVTGKKYAYQLTTKTAYINQVQEYFFYSFKLNV